MIACRHDLTVELPAVLHVGRIAVEDAAGIILEHARHIGSGVDRGHLQPAVEEATGSAQSPDDLLRPPSVGDHVCLLVTTAERTGRHDPRETRPVHEDCVECPADSIVGLLTADLVTQGQGGGRVQDLPLEGFEVFLGADHDTPHVGDSLVEVVGEEPDVGVVLGDVEKVAAATDEDGVVGGRRLEERAERLVEGGEKTSLRSGIAEDGHTVCLTWWPPAPRHYRPGSHGSHSGPEENPASGFEWHTTRMLRKLGRPAMKGLAAALDEGRVLPPFRRSQLRGRVPDELLEGLVGELEDLSARGMTPGHIAHMLRLLAEERAATQAIADRVELVWSGTEVMAGASRDTAVVVQELFREAREAVLIASYALDTGSKARTLFGTLAKRMDAEPDLRVRLFDNYTAGGTGVTTVDVTIPAGTGTGAITESGIFDDPVAGTMWNRYTFAAVNKTASDALKVTCSMTFTSV